MAYITNWLNSTLSWPPHGNSLPFTSGPHPSDAGWDCWPPQPPFILAHFPCVMKGAVGGGGWSLQTTSLIHSPGHIQVLSLVPLLGTCPLPISVPETSSPMNEAVWRGNKWVNISWPNSQTVTGQTEILAEISERENLKMSPRPCSDPLITWYLHRVSGLTTFRKHTWTAWNHWPTFLSKIV